MQIIYNPRCQKCQNLRSALDDAGKEWEEEAYLKNLLDRDKITEIFDAYPGNWHDLIRTKERIFVQKRIDVKSLSRKEGIKLIYDHPRLLQRPIAMKDGVAYIVRDDGAVANLVQG